MVLSTCIQDVWDCSNISLVSECHSPRTLHHTTFCVFRTGCSSLTNTLLQLLDPYVMILRYFRTAFLFLHVIGSFKAHRSCQLGAIFRFYVNFFARFFSVRRERIYTITISLTALEGSAASSLMLMAVATLCSPDTFPGSLVTEVELANMR